MPHSRHTPHNEESFGPLLRVFFLSAAFMVAEIVGGIWTGSLALLADSGHMAIDTAAVALSLFALWVSRRPPTAVRTYGYYRAEILAASVNGALLVGVAVWIFYEAWQRLSHPQAIDGAGMTVIAVGGLFVNLAGLRLVHQHSKSSLNLKAVSLHLVFDALGSIGAIVAGLLVLGCGWVWADAAVSLLLAVLILVGAFKLLMECVDVLLESAPAGLDLAAIRRELAAVTCVSDIHDLHVWSLATGVVALSAHVRVKSGADHGRVLSACTELLHANHGIDHATLQLEPEAYSHEDTHLDCQKEGDS